MRLAPPVADLDPQRGDLILLLELPGPVDRRRRATARRYREQAKRFSVEELVTIHRRIAEADRALKSGASEEIVLPVLVAEIAGAEAAA